MLMKQICVERVLFLWLWIFQQYIPATRAQATTSQPGGGQTNAPGGAGADDTYLVEASFWARAATQSNTDTTL